MIHKIPFSGNNSLIKEATCQQKILIKVAWLNRELSRAVKSLVLWLLGLMKNSSQVTVYIKNGVFSGFDCTALICKEVSQGNGVPANRITKITQFLSPVSCCLGQIS